MEPVVKSRNIWYIAGLHFECTQCSRCCSGPAEGDIWVSRPEIKFIADYLKMPLDELRSKYLKRVGIRFSIIEDKTTKDCIFLEKVDGRKRCRIYPVRPNQCRAWPFWSSNLTSRNSWNEATRRCEGVNRGRLYSFEEIEKIRKSKRWWENEDPDKSGIDRVRNIYREIDEALENSPQLTGRCSACGKCCNFESYDHRLYVTPPELEYLAYHIGRENIKPMTDGICPYNVNGKCTVYEYRFASCRIFCCTGDKDFQRQLTESTLTDLKKLCLKFEMPYSYRQLSEVLS